MRRKLLYSFGILFSLFIISFLLSSCDLFKNMIATKKPVPETEPEDVEEDKTIYFGSYPQTRIYDNTLINELNSLAGELPTSTNLFNWIDYNYYIGGNITSYMYYQDIDYDNNGTYDYRGVYLKEYRPQNFYDASDATNSYQDDKNYYLNISYWFKYETIEWNILTKADGKVFVVSNLLLDCHEYYSSDGNNNIQFNHNGGIGYANNYELSNIRKWLNDNFYNTAFNELEKNKIQITEVDNSVSSTCQEPNIFACNNTNDKIFLLSYAEINNYLGNEDLRKANGTDYAESQGLGFNSWSFRSPGAEDYDSIPDSDLICGSNEHGVISTKGLIYYTAFGVRPACWINL